MHECVYKINFKKEKKKKVKLINRDCLPILMLYVMLAYLMLSVFIMLFLAFLFLPLIFANAFCFHALSWFIDK